MNSKDQSLKYSHAVNLVMKLGNSEEVNHDVGCKYDRICNEIHAGICK